MKSKSQIRLSLLVFLGLLCQFTITSQESLYPFAEKGKYGYINKAGKVVVTAQYEYSEKFYEGMGVVKQGGKRGFVDITGKLVIPAKYDQKIDGYFSEGLACVKQGAKYSYIDKTGKEVLAPKCEHAYKYGEEKKLNWLRLKCLA
jgi:hypothetical protein